MMFLSEMSFLSFDPMCFDNSVIDISEVNELKIQNGFYTALLLTEDYLYKYVELFDETRRYSINDRCKQNGYIYVAKIDMEPGKWNPYNWQLDSDYSENMPVRNITPTIKDQLNVKMLCYFEYNCDCGDLDFNPDNLTALAVKRRNYSDYNWKTIYVHEINGTEDFEVTGMDYLPTTGSYEYALVPVKTDYVSGKVIEGKYTKSGKIDVKVGALTLIDGNTSVPNIWYTKITDGNCDVVQNIETNILNTMFNKYATVVRNSETNYASISVSGEFYPSLENGCIIDTSDETDIERNEWIAKFIEFLTNGYPKMLKNIDGRAWIVAITGQPTNTADGHYKKRKISFNCTEIGSIDDTEFLYKSGLIDSSVTKEYW